MSQKKKVIFYLIDGARPDVLQKLLEQNELPAIQEYLVSNGSFVKGTTCFPSTTGPAYLPFLTGASPGDHHITGIRWFDKKAFFKGRWGRNSMRSYCGYEAKFFNDDMNPKYPSLFERSAVVAAPLVKFASSDVSKAALAASTSVHVEIS